MKLLLLLFVSTVCSGTLTEETKNRLKELTCSTMLQTINAMKFMKLTGQFYIDLTNSYERLCKTTTSTSTTTESVTEATTMSITEPTTESGTISATDNGTSTTASVTPTTENGTTSATENSTTSAPCVLGGNDCADPGSIDAYGISYCHCNSECSSSQKCCPSHQGGQRCNGVV